MHFGGCIIVGKRVYRMAEAGEIGIAPASVRLKTVLARQLIDE